MNLETYKVKLSYLITRADILVQNYKGLDTNIQSESVKALLQDRSTQVIRALREDLDKLDKEFFASQSEPEEAAEPVQQAPQTPAAQTPAAQTPAAQTPAAQTPQTPPVQTPPQVPQGQGGGAPGV